MAKQQESSGGGGGVAGRFLLFILITLAVGCLVLKRDEMMDENVEAKVEAGDAESRIPAGMCPKFCEARLKQLMDHHGGADFTQTSDLLEKAKSEREKMIGRLEEMYGKGERYYESIFHNVDGKRRKFFIGPGDQEARVSEKRFQRKLGMKILKMQASLIEENSNLEGCDCTHGDEVESQRRRRLQGGDDVLKIVLPDVKSTYDSVVWGSGGHSAAASHGNLLHESYPEYMERMAKDVFKSVGLDLIGRNYAMGGMNTAPEVALCLESKMGLDADIISWDSGMTEAGNPKKFDFYANRVGQHRNRPVFAGIQLGQSSGAEPKIETMRRMENWGMSTLYFPGEVHDAMHEGYPDMTTLSGPDAEAAPEYAAYFICGDKKEEGEPRCGDMKYTETTCVNRVGKASWHPGWKFQANVGHAMALFMVDSLIETLEDINFAEANKVTGEKYDPLKLYKQLKETEDSDYDKFKETALELPTDMHEVLEEFPEGEDLKPWIPLRKHSYCHSSHLPSESRYLGLFDGNFTSSRDGFERGIGFKDLKKMAEESSEVPSTDQPMKLVFDEKLHENGTEEDGSPCAEPVQLDFKDWLSVTNKDGWSTVTFPNELELEYYKPDDDSKPKGLIMLCFVLCDWGNCPDGELNRDRLEALEFELNGQRVKQMIPIGEQCSFLQHHKGFFFDPNEKGQYELRARVGLWEKDQPDVLSYIRITSLAVV
eukprot:CAMPEP_0194035874 /NCGR_PEP_ID=MMETSP0009_2-20130614/8291_1 /TAXON_ID=210454 /ORGANISM="Grammatophora oceanica, Strain CCMP 410" /LENGTH=710 /DNA_ID=CAMNT_0038677425 /DNA_START=42 /DNA_END=2177 /DNA_ORIENTATION=+